MGIIASGSGFDGITEAYIYGPNITVKVNFKNEGQTNRFYLVLWYWKGEPYGTGEWVMLNYKEVIVSPGSTVTESIVGSIPMFKLGRVAIAVSVNDVYTGQALDSTLGVWVYL
ncbi:MAG: hypothetical protein QXK24_07895 [Ignisphaera sp.]